MRLTQIKVPTLQGAREVEGYVIWLHIAGNRHKFFLQMDINRPSVLTDYASGYRLTNLAPMALARYVGRPYGTRYVAASEWRKLAQEWLDETTLRHGPDYVIGKLKSVPRLNA